MLWTSRSSLVGAAALFALLALGLIAQAADAEGGSAPGPGGKVFDDSLTVLEVEVPVRVLRAGVPVPGLSVDDFEILDRDIKQTITGFDVLDIREERMAASSSAPTAMTTVPRTSRRNLLLVIDLNRLGSNAFLRARPRLEAWLERPFAPTDRVALALFGTVDQRTPRDKSVHLLTPFTADRTRLRLALDVVDSVYDRKPKKTEAALAALAAHEASPQVQALMRATVREIGIPAALSLLATPYGESSALGRLGDSRITRRLKEREAFAVVEDGRGIFGDADFRVSGGSPESSFRWLALAMAEAVTLLADLEGQNHVVLLTEPGYPEIRDSNTTGRLEPMHNAFRRSGWTFDAIDASGVGFRGGTLFYMANETGGELLENQLEIDGALDRLLLRTDLTYRLSFRPSDLGEPGSYHALEVLATSGGGPRIQVLHRAGYYAPRPDAHSVRLEDWFSLERMLREGRELNPEVLHIAAPVRTAQGGVTVRVEIEVGAMFAGVRDALTLDLVVLAVDHQGAVSSRRREQVEVPAVAARRPATLVRTVQLNLAPGHYRLRVLAEHRASGAVALASATAVLEAGGGKRR